MRFHHAAGQLLTVPDGISLLGAALVRSGQEAAGARMLAAGQAWRASHALAVVGRLAQRAIEAAGAELALLPPDEEIESEAARGAAAPFGRIDALDLPVTMDLRDDRPPRVLRLVDVRQRDAQTSDVPPRAGSRKA